MTKVWLMGGFGNILFQILVYRVLRKTKKDVFYIKNLTEKNFLTKKMNWTIHQELYNDLILEKEFYKQSTFKSILPVLLAFFSKKSNKNFKLVSFYTKDNKFDEKKVAKNVFGYFQEKYFLSEYKDDLIKLGDDLRSLYANDTSKKIVVHYRKGDTDWGIRYSYYYDKVRELLKEENEEITIVTDSQKDAELFFQAIPKVNIVSSSNAMDDFKCLISTRKLYCAPSTFSWWAAHSLSSNSQVVIPAFFQDKFGMYLKTNKLTLLSQ